MTTQQNKGNRTRLAQKLKKIGVTNIGELITTDDYSLGTQLTEGKAKVLRARAKIRMIPGLDEKEVELLEQMGITGK